MLHLFWTSSFREVPRENWHLSPRKVISVTVIPVTIIAVTVMLSIEGWVVLRIYSAICYQHLHHGCWYFTSRPMLGTWNHTTHRCWNSSAILSRMTKSVSPSDRWNMEKCHSPIPFNGPLMARSERGINSSHGWLPWGKRVHRCGKSTSCRWFSWENHELSTSMLVYANRNPFSARIPSVASRTKGAFYLRCGEGCPGKSQWMFHSPQVMMLHLVTFI